MAEESMEKDMEEAADHTSEEQTDEAAEQKEPQTETDPKETEGPKADDKKGKPDKKDAQIEELTDRVKRQMAEFENFRKRSEKEKAGMFEMGVKSVIEQLLPVVDNFERGLAGLSEEAKKDPFAEGVEKIYRQLEEMLTKLDVKPIEAVGAAFDPELHNAVMHVEDEEAEENVIVEEFLKGYTYKDQVVRHSMVKVAN